ncbi:bifunctional hydroxymethylpyrimidine kinase/phosphomethylpyrimidine kinase [Fulvimonas soli]|jgi:hydroxymethylpyrimidine/phosphomethylpyrimidine kinase|uniref:hydroxymethylpyrimidine kinase n=1 Tax=Fulvimonas soli TaxID=155197 RepID=A0A316IIR3_9GAMM|nr:bifunctional hydroxymethylpyrimidine kinase/phosphomethylpyrimidine kinase [Fulvimonas soli]PWK92790.1 hydroxymethylpyrimidine/phosphomethylpyrimidine kinase [Fulvimonas soli]TNY28064.1 bifunctional hydroxymethylpyrimidine kinase/phosphomethylpyrimidine kinase [Fulvimonas soli]
MPRIPPPIALTIAGSDSGGGAGIQADLKTFQALGVHGLSAVAAITSQNTRGVTAVHPVPLKHIRSQIAAVFDDFPVAAVKTGMLGSAAITRLVAREMAARKPAWLVVDPVMIATSGARLLDADAVAVLVEELIPLADVLTPNLPEAEALLGRPIRRPADFDRTGEALLALGARAVLLKGGHAGGREVVDRYYDGRGRLELRHPRLPQEFHGTGCTLASAVAAELARGRAPRSAVRRATAYVRRALGRGYRPGGGRVHVLGH